ncbi:MAG TPA: glycosyltransferase family A protein [Allosphingosinicella sp.]|nr:glycosyltransferase family A protein [Allosphingosinicella sp.]
MVMPVHNAMPYLDEAVASILAQSFGDFEFVILDDGSTDGSRERLREWSDQDARIRLVVGEGRSGPVESSNRVVRESRGVLVARMDADDRAHPDRLRLQMGALGARVDAVLVGSLCDTIDARGRSVRGPDYARLFRRSPFAPFPHSSILFRRSDFDQAGGYRSEACRWEDVDLYLRLARLGRMIVIAQPLVSIRQSETSTRLTAAPADLEQAMDRMYRAVGTPLPEGEGRLVPEAYLPGAMIRVWNGRRPRILGRLWRQGALGLNASSLAMLAWALWAEMSPRALRLALRMRLKVRNRAARRRLAGRAIVEWAPHRA